MISAELVKKLREKTGAGILDSKKALEETNGDIDKAIDWLREKGIAKSAKKADRIAAEGLAKVLIDGYNAIILEVNSETDFVAKNEKFIELVDTIAQTLVKTDLNISTVNGALEEKAANGKTLNELITEATATIGEKISFRRFAKDLRGDDEVFGSYSHMGGKIAVLVELQGGTEEIAKDVCMHIAAMNPEYIRREDVPEDVVEQEKKILTEQAMNEGKPKEIAEKMVQGRVNKFFKEICLLEQPFIKDDSKTVEQFLKENNAVMDAMYRYEVGEGMEKREENFAEEVEKQING